VPESFKVLVKELQSLGLAIEVINEEERAVLSAETATMLEATGETPEAEEGTGAVAPDETTEETPKLEADTEVTEETTETEEGEKDA